MNNHIEILVVNDNSEVSFHGWKIEDTHGKIKSRNSLFKVKNIFIYLESI